MLRRHRAETVICLGDSFHDRAAGQRLSEPDAAFLPDLVASHEWIWIAGNHDPASIFDLGGRILRELAMGEIVFRHQAAPATANGEVSGHFHPMTTVRLRVGRLAGRCFVSDGRRLVLPAFGAFAGGLDIFDPAIVRLFPDGFPVHLIGRDRVVAVSPTRLAPSSQVGLSHKSR